MAYHVGFELLRNPIEIAPLFVQLTTRPNLGFTLHDLRVPNLRKLLPQLMGQNSITETFSSTGRKCAAFGVPRLAPFDGYGFRRYSRESMQAS